MTLKIKIPVDDIETTNELGLTQWRSFRLGDNVEEILIYNFTDWGGAWTAILYCKDNKDGSYASNPIDISNFTNFSVEEPLCSSNPASDSCNNKAFVFESTSNIGEFGGCATDSSNCISAPFYANPENTNGVFYLEPSCTLIPLQP